MQSNPQVYFGQSIGLRVAMTGVAGVWTDTMWINGYSGGDVKSMCAIHTSRQGTPRIWVSTQECTSTTYGTMYELLSSYNYNDFSPTKTGTGASGTWGINISGNAATATNISNTGTVNLASATESNAITITAPSISIDKPVKLLNFN